MDVQKILNKLRIEQLNEMQQHAAEAILGSDGDVVLLSPTGSGKTLAYLLPLIQLIDANGQSSMVNGQWPTVLVITPGRELALQSDNVLKSMGCGLRSTACYGGRAAMDEHKVLKEVKPQIVFGTPGRLNDHLDKENIARYGIRYLVIDEFDKCLEMGFQAEMQKLIKSLPGLQRRILLSATNAEEIPGFVNMSKKGTLIDFLPEEEQTSERVTLYEVRSEEKDKLGTLKQLLLSFGDESSIVFLNYRNAVERVSDYLKEEGFTISSFHGGDGYIHRVGRTARWDATGKTFFILNSEEHIPEYVEGDVVPYAATMPQPTEPAQPKMATLYIGKGKKDKISKGDIVGFLCKSGGLKADEIGRIDVKDRYAYVAIKREKLKQVLRQTQGEKIKGIKTVVEPVR